VTARGSATISRSAGALRILPINRAAAFAGAGVLAAVNALAAQIISGFSRGPTIGNLGSLAGISAVIWFALYAALKIGWDAGREPLRRLDWLVIAFVIAASMVPLSDAARGALLVCAFYAFVTTRPGEPARRVALLLAALTGTLVWGPLILNVFAGPLLALDAQIVSRAIGSSVDGNVVQFTHSGSTFLVATGCSSIHNISLAIVLWCAVVALFNLRPDARLIGFGVAMMAFMFALNTARLCAIGLYPSEFEFLHTGVGAALFGWAGLIGIGTLAMIGANDALARRA
jgi:exosortase/archaeosortase family protein